MTTNLMPDDRRSLTLRLGVVQYIVAVTFAVLAVGFWVFQIGQHEKFREMAENNRLRKLPLPAPRGVLLDRHGKVLVENQNTFNIALVREQTKNLSEVLRVVAAATGVDLQQLQDVVNRRRREPSFRPIVLIENASQAQVVAIMARRLELPGVFYQPVPSRKYPDRAVGAHLFGYVGEVTEPQLQRADYKDIEPGAIVGQAGVELAYNKQLMGVDGAKAVIVNSVGREIRELKSESQEPVIGRPMQLTIDADVQKATEDGFAATGFDGAAVVLDPRNGEVLSFTSRPSFDPNAFTAGIDRTAWSALINDPLKPLQNRALQGTFSPGSTFKMAVGLAGLEEGIVRSDFRVFCGGGQTFYGRYFRCHKESGHGSVDLRQAIEQSCDVFFYTVGNMLGVDRIHKWATRLGLGVKSGIDLPNEVPGLVPSTEWKAKYTKEKKWYAGETISVSIGQGQVSVTPVSLAVYTATLANGGTRVTPHLIKAIDEGNGLKPVPPPAPQSKIEMTPDMLHAVRDGMWMVVNGAAGTARRARIEGKDVCGKTGTAQVISLAGRLAARNSTRNLRDHGWFTFFAPRDNPEIAGVVFLEHGIHSANAASVAKHILETYFAKKEGRPLPPPPTREQMRLDLSDRFARPARAGAGQH
jgi:penicillin-binding protein 2